MSEPYLMGIGSTVVTIGRWPNGVIDIGLAHYSHELPIGSITRLDNLPEMGPPTAVMRFASTSDFADWARLIVKNAQSMGDDAAAMADGKSDE